MKREEWRSKLNSLLKQRDEILKKQQILKCQAQINSDVSTISNSIMNELYTVHNELNHCNFMLERLISDEVFDSIEDINQCNKEDQNERDQKAGTVK